MKPDDSPTVRYDSRRTPLPAGTDLESYRHRQLGSPRLPAERRVAVVVSLWVESAEPMWPDPEWSPAGVPRWLDVSAWSLYEYGSRTGVFRLGAMFDRLGVKATLAINDKAARTAPRVLELACERNWEVVGHGAAANQLVTSRMTDAAERAYLQESRDVLHELTGKRPLGWVGPALSESQRTPEIAARLGYRYLMDWGNDDRPSLFAGPDWEIVSIPALVDLSDHLVLSGTADTPWSFAQTLEDHLRVLLQEDQDAVMTLTLRAHLSGQPFRAKYIEQFLSFARACEGVWFPTADEVVDTYRSLNPHDREESTNDRPRSVPG